MVRISRPAIDNYTVINTGPKKIGPASAGAAAARDLTFTGLPTDGQTMTVIGPSGTRVYTYKDTITNSIPNQIKIGADVTAMGTNTKDALNQTAGLTTFSLSTRRNEDVVGSNVAGVMTATARRGGADGNLIQVADDLSNASWAGATLAAGADPDVLIPQGATQLWIINPNVESVAATPTKLLRASPSSTAADGGLHAVLGFPVYYEWDAGDPPTLWVHTAETSAIDFYVQFSR